MTLLTKSTWIYESITLQLFSSSWFHCEEGKADAAASWRGLITNPGSKAICKNSLLKDNRRGKRVFRENSVGEGFSSTTAVDDDNDNETTLAWFPWGSRGEFVGTCSLEENGNTSFSLDELDSSHVPLSWLSDPYKHRGSSSSPH